MSVPRPNRIVVVDNYDSFTWNLVHLAHAAAPGAEVIVRRSREVTVAAALALRPSHVILSPGPGDPSREGDAGISCALVREAPATLPILGVCLGHQAIGVAFGARVVPAREIVHGKERPVHPTDDPLFVGLARPFEAMRYHSLVVDPSTLPPSLRSIATAADGTLMAMRHVERPVVGLQFHPESVGTPSGLALLRAFLHDAPRSSVR